MKAAVLHTLGKPPRCEDFPDPQPEQNEVLVHVRAASLKNYDKMMASGTHYDRHSGLPVICGSDGVGVLDDGKRVFCGGSRPPYGMMAQKTVVPRLWCMPVPENVDDATAAALPNPALSSWLPLIWRAQLKPGETVLILGATGVAGKLAIQIANHLGAGRVVAAGRNKKTLESLHDLGADTTIDLDQPDEQLAGAFTRECKQRYFDVVLDYLWGHVTEVLIHALTGHDATAVSSRVRIVEIGEMAGADIRLPAAALRSSGIELYGSGGGGIVPHQAIFDAFPQLWSLAANGKLRMDLETVPLTEIEMVWEKQNSQGRRIVLIP